MVDEERAGDAVAVAETPASSGGLEPATASRSYARFQRRHNTRFGKEHRILKHAARKEEREKRIEDIRAAVDTEEDGGGGGGESTAVGGSDAEDEGDQGAGGGGASSPTDLLSAEDEEERRQRLRKHYAEQRNRWRAGQFGRNATRGDASRGDDGDEDGAFLERPDLSVHDSNEDYDTFHARQMKQQQEELARLKREMMQLRAEAQMSAILVPEPTARDNAVLAAQRLVSKAAEQMELQTQLKLDKARRRELRAVRREERRLRRALREKQKQAEEESRLQMVAAVEARARFEREQLQKGKGEDRAEQGWCSRNCNVCVVM